LFSIGRKITLCIEFVYKEVACDSATANGKKKKKKKSATEAQRLQRAAKAGLWTRVYKQYRYRAKHCKQGPCCWLDKRGIHQKLLPGQLKEIVGHIKETIKKGETEEDVDVRIEILPYIIKNILENNRKRKADGFIDHRQYKAHTSSYNRCCDIVEIPPVKKLGNVEGDRQAMLKKYCNWGLV
jgi:hypothetical protein